MTKKHFEAVAKIIKSRMALIDEDIKRFSITNEAAEARRYEVRTFASMMADTFHADNPRFDRGRFISACGL